MIPIAVNVPKNERWLIERFGDLGFNVDVRNNDAKSLFIEFIVRSVARMLNYDRPN